MTESNILCEGLRGKSTKISELLNYGESTYLDSNLGHGGPRLVAVKEDYPSRDRSNVLSHVVPNKTMLRVRQIIISNFVLIFFNKLHYTALASTNCRLSHHISYPNFLFFHTFQ